MTLRNTFFAIASLSLLATGCLGALEPTGPGGGPPAGDDDDDQPIPPAADAGITPPSTAKPMFDSTVAPILQASCSAAACHGGVGNSPLKYLPDNIADYYSVVTSYDDRVVGYFDKAAAPMLTRIQPGPHYNVTYTAEQAAAISAWLDAELEARSTGGTPGADAGPGGTPGTPGQVSKQLIAEWSGCMELAVWNEEQIATRWAEKGTSEGPCVNCHINAQASFIATDDSERMFNILTTNKYYMLGYFQPNVIDLATAKMEINRAGLERVGNAVYPYTEHPQFNVDGQAYEALVRFYDRTLARKAAGTCDPPRLTTP